MARAEPPMLPGGIASLVKGTAVSKNPATAAIARTLGELQDEPLDDPERRNR